MKETVLLYNFTDKGRAMKVKQALLPLGFRLKVVDPKDYLKPVGMLAGVKGMEETGQGTEERFAGSGATDTVVAGTDDSEANDGIGFSDEMILMAGFTSAQIDALIKALRRRGVGKIDYKAVLTETNKDWNSFQLYEEIKKEHEAMSQG